MGEEALHAALRRYYDTKKLQHVELAVGGVTARILLDRDPTNNRRTS